MAFELPTLPFPRDSYQTPYIASPDASGKYTVASGQWFKNASNLWVPVSATDPLPIKVQTELPAGAQVIGQVKLTDGTDALLVNANGSINIVPVDSAGTELFTDANPGNVQLTGSSVQDTQTAPKSIPINQAMKDIAMRAYENIIDILGLENICMFLPLWENTGTVYKDLIRPRDIQFNIIGATLAQEGILHPVPSFDGVNDYLVEKPVITSMNNNSVLTMDSGAKMFAQKFMPMPNSFVPSFVRLFLGKVESVAGNLDSATIQLEIRADSSGVPESSVLASSPVINVSALFTTACWWGLYLTSSVAVDRGVPYWFVLKYVGSTGVDASNYVTVGLDTSGSYGYSYATYDGATWTVTTGQNISFEIYNDAMNFFNAATSGYSVIFPFYKSELNPGAQVLLALGRHGLTGSGDMPAAVKLEIGGSFNDARMALSWDDYYSIKTVQAYYAGVGGGWNVWAMVNDFAASTGKIKIYWNGSVMKSIDGTEGLKPSREIFPSTVATVAHLNGNPASDLYANMKGGPIIATNNVVTQAQLAKVINQLLALRRLREAV